MLQDTLQGMPRGARGLSQSPPPPRATQVEYQPAMTSRHGVSPPHDVIARGLPRPMALRETSPGLGARAERRRRKRRKSSRGRRRGKRRGKQRTRGRGGGEGGEEGEREKRRKKRRKGRSRRALSEPSAAGSRSPVGYRIQLQPRSGFAPADGPERGSRAWRTQSEPPGAPRGAEPTLIRSLINRTPTHLAPALRTRLFLSTAASILLHRTGTHPGATLGTPSPTGNPVRPRAPLCPPTQTLSPRSSNGWSCREGSSERGNREGGGRVTPATRTLSPGRRGQRGTRSRALCHQAWRQPEHPTGARSHSHAPRSDTVTASLISLPQLEQEGAPSHRP